MALEIDGILLLFFFLDINVSALDVDMLRDSVYVSQYYQGGSNNGYYGFIYNSILRVSNGGSGYGYSIVRGGIGELGITDFAVDWMARKWRFSYNFLNII